MFHRLKHNLFYKVAVWAVVMTFGASPCQPAYAQSILNLPEPGAMVFLSPSFTLAMMKGMTIYPDDPFKFDFIIDRGDTTLEGDDFKAESAKLIKYFLASLTTSEEKMWVNLSPYEKDRIIADGFDTTEMGRDLLAQDYILKQLTASLLYPENELGKLFWNKVYSQAKEKLGINDIPMNTFNKVWIVPERAEVYVHGKSAFVVGSHLKVMLEEEYLNSDTRYVVRGTEEKERSTYLVARTTLKEIIIPAIEKEVNEGKNFAQLRQIYHSLILATWYKKNLKKSLFGQMYVDKNKTKGVDVEDKQIKQKIYEQYLAAFKKGAYDYIKEDYDPVTQEVISKKYFSGGVDAAMMGKVLNESLQLTQGDLARLAETLDEVVTTKIHFSNSVDAATLGDASSFTIATKEFYIGQPVRYQNQDWKISRRIQSTVVGQVREGVEIVSEKEGIAPLRLLMSADIDTIETDRVFSTPTQPVAQSRVSMAPRLSKKDLVKELRLSLKKFNALSRLVRKIFDSSPADEAAMIDAIELRDELSIPLSNLYHKADSTKTEDEKDAEYQAGSKNFIGAFVEHSITTSKNAVRNLQNNQSALVKLPIGLNNLIKIIDASEERGFEVFQNGSNRFLWIIPGTPTISEYAEEGSLVTGEAKVLRGALGHFAVLSGHSHPQDGDAAPSDTDIEVAQQDNVEGKDHFIIAVKDTENVEVSLTRNGQFQTYQGEEAKDVLRELGIINSSDSAMTSDGSPNPRNPNIVSRIEEEGFGAAQTAENFRLDRGMIGENITGPNATPLLPLVTILGSSLVKFRDSQTSETNWDTSSVWQIVDSTMITLRNIKGPAFEQDILKAARAILKDSEFTFNYDVLREVIGIGIQKDLKKWHTQLGNQEFVHQLRQSDRLVNELKDLVRRISDFKKYQKQLRDYVQTGLAQEGVARAVADEFIFQFDIELNQVHELTAVIAGQLKQKSLSNLANIVQGEPNLSLVSSKPKKDDLKGLQDPAMMVTKDDETPGGIDLNPNKMDLQTTGENTPLYTPVDPAMLENMINIDGAYPVIINITPVLNLPLLLGIEIKKKEEQYSYNIPS